MSKQKKDLVQIIRDNPGCVVTVDNDCWWINAADAGDDDDPIVSSDDNLMPLGDGGYGSGNCYASDVLQALAVIVGVKIESV